MQNEQAASVSKRNICALCIFALAFGTSGCSPLGHYRLVSEEYGFSVEFPDKPTEQPGTNYQGLPKSLWTLISSKGFFSAEATRYRERLNPGAKWIPNSENLASVGIQTTQSRRFKLRTVTGREALAIATTARQAISGDISSIYIVDGRTRISITARTDNQQHRKAFLDSLTLLR